MAENPTQDELAALIDKGMGNLLNPEDIDQRKKLGELPDNFKISEGFGVYRVDVGGKEYLCVTNILCDKCERINGKVKRCEMHKRKRKGRRGQRSDVQDDASDRDKVSGLRHVEDDDDEEDKIDGAFTPDAVMTPGIGGAIITVLVDAKNNEKAGPPAKNMHHVKGILVRGPGYVPQFIPNDRLTKAHKLRFENYVEGEMVLLNGKEVFVPNGLNPGKMDGKSGTLTARNAISKQVDPRIAEAIGKDMVVPVQVEIADNGVPVMKILDKKPVDKETPVGIILKINDETQFVQIAGKELGGGRNAKMLPCVIPDNAKTGDAIADIYINQEGKGVAAKPGEVPKGQEQIGQVVMGLNDQLVYVPKGADKFECIRRAALMTGTTRDKLEGDQIRLQSVITGQNTEHIHDQMKQIGNGGAYGSVQRQTGEVRSMAFGNTFGASVNAKNQPVGAGVGATGRGGAGEIHSVGFGNQYGRSVMVKPLPSGAGGAMSGATGSGGQPVQGSGYSGGSGGGATGAFGGASGGAAGGRSGTFSGGATGPYGGSSAGFTGPNGAFSGGSSGGVAGGATGPYGGSSAGFTGPTGNYQSSPTGKPTGYSGVSARDVNSVAFNQQYGGSIHFKQGGGTTGAGTVASAPPAKTTGTFAGTGAGSNVGTGAYGHKFGASIYMKK
uniref:Uncharacterized protein n=1 Tax=Caenorhabditis japonica TaxID=281687 RepID=A0A8R1E1L4_CAEJA